MSVYRVRVGITLLAVLAGVVAGCGKKEDASARDSAAFERARKITDARRRGDEFLRIARSRQQAGTTGDAADAIAAAVAAARQVEDPYEQCRLLCRGVFLYEAVGYGHETDELVKLAAAEVEGIEDIGQRVEISAQLAEIYKRYRDKPSVADLYLEDCEKLAGEIEVLEDRVRAFMVTAYYSHRLGGDEDEERLVMSALTAATEVDDARRQSDLYSELGTRLLRLERVGQSDEAFVIAEEGALAVEDDLSRGYALIDLAVRLKTAGKAGRAKQLLAMSVEIANEQSEGALRRELLDKVREVE